MVADAHNDAARTAGSFANQSKRLMAALKELAAGIMGNVLPMATAIVHALAEGAEAAKEFLIQMGLIDEPKETAISRRVVELRELSTELDEGKKKLAELEERFGKLPAFEQSMGSTYYGSAQLTPEMMGRRHFEDQVKHVERLTQSLHELRIELKRISRKSTTYF